MFFEPRSVASELFARSLREEFRRKSRFASRGYHTFSFFPSIIFPRSGRTAFLLWSHKLFRWLSPFFVIVIALFAGIGVILAQNIFYTTIIVGLTFLGLMTLIGMLADWLGFNIPIVRQLSWLIVMNFAYVVGTVKYITRSDEQIWRSSSRAENKPLK